MTSTVDTIHRYPSCHTSGRRMEDGAARGRLTPGQATLQEGLR